MPNNKYDQANEPSKRLSLKERIRRLWELNNTPREIAMGVAIGVFIAITPFYGLHTIMVIIAAFLIRRANKIAILLGTNINTTLTFPFITWAGYNIGRLIIDGGYPPLEWVIFKKFSYKTILELYYPLLIGSIILGVLLACIFYLLIFWAVCAHAAAKKRP